MESRFDKASEFATNAGHPDVATAALDDWAEYDWRDAVTLDHLSPFDRIVATTRNNTYEIVVVSPRDRAILVRGGTALPAFVSARLIGCSLGGSIVKLRTVAVGFRIQLVTESEGLLVTTAVKSLSIMPAGSTRPDVTS